MGTTPKYQLPYPELTDPPNGPAQMQALALSVDNALGTVIPIGGIIMWSGTVATIPVNWALCDGANGTPNLRGRFIVGASVDTGGTNSGASYNKGATGGADSTLLTTAHLPAHSHSMAAAGLHNHPTWYRYGYTVDAGTSSAMVLSNAGGATQSADLGTLNDGTHSHTINASPAASQQVPTRPLFYSLAYIMKVA